MFTLRRRRERRKLIGELEKLMKIQKANMKISSTGDALNTQQNTNVVDEFI